MGANRCIPWLCLVAIGSAPGEDIRERVDLKYQFYRDRNRVDNHTVSALIVKRLASALALQWDQTLDAVSGASRSLGTGLRGVPRPGDYDGVSGASRRDEMRHASRGALVYSRKGDRVTAGLYFSEEDDYSSLSPSLSLARDFRDGNTTISLDGTLFRDRFTPRGVFAGMGGNKRIASGNLTLAQVLSPLTLADATLSVISSSGYLGHPYLAPMDTRGSLVLENLPDRRLGMAAAGQILQGYRLGGLLGSLSLAGKRYQDDWNQRATEIDFRWSQHVGETAFLRLRLRRYDQTGAAFSGVPAPDQRYRTADVRLHPFTSWLAGAKLASAFPEAWSAAALLPDRWDIGYEYLTRNTRGDGDGIARPRLYQLYSPGEVYDQGTFSLGMGFDY